jgi:septum formation protein
MSLILGSQSPWRKQILDEMGLQFEVVVPDVDEKSFRVDDPFELTQTLAMMKSLAVRRIIGDRRDALVLTSDQVVVVGGIIREKPRDADEARMFLRSYRSLPAECVTAVYGFATYATGKRGQAVMMTDRAKVYFRDLSIEAVEHIIDDGVIFSCAGGFAAGHPSFDPYIERIEGTRDSAMGMPKKCVESILRTLAAD